MSQRWRHEEAAAPRFEPAMATRGGRRPRFEPSMATRGRRPPQHANYVRTTRTVRRPSSNYNTSGHTTGLAHQSRELARCFGKSPRNLMAGSETVAGRLRVATRGGCRPQPFDKPFCAPERRVVRAVFELRHEEGAGHNHNPIRGPRQGHRRFFKRTSTLTPG